MTILLLIIGLVFLIVGAEALVRGASRIAASVGISSLVIGLTVVAFGTSSPELAVSIMASTSDQSDIAMGNVLGSNIFNILFILGLSAIITPMIVHLQIIRIDVPILIALSAMVWIFGLDGNINRWEALILALLGVGYIFLAFHLSKKEKNKSAQAEYNEAFGEVPPKNKHWQSVLYIILGLVLLIFGSRFLVNSAVVIAKSLGVSDLVIGLTIIAAGTSLPEVATSIIAALRGERDIAVGNAIGSNLFNIFFILGIAGMISGDGINVADSALRFDIPVMVFTAVACLPLFFTGKKLDRWEGMVFFLYYIAYTIYLVLSSQQHAALYTYSRAMLWFVIPLTIITLIVVTLRNRKHNNANREA
jgi:cation:H+ antiporter